MSVVVAYEEVGPCRKQLTIEIPAPAVEAEAGRVAGEMRRNLKLPGFRQGKVPTSLVTKRFREDIDREVADRLIPRYWKQAEAEKSLDPLLPPRVEDLKMNPGEAMTFVASVETRPRIELSSLEGFDLPDADPTPSESEIDDAIEGLRSQHSTWKVIDRPAARGDLVAADMLELPPDDAEPGEPQPIEVEVGQENLWEELTLALTGLKAGQSSELTRSEGEGEEAQERRFRVTAKEVKERELPEVDDSFAGRLDESLKTVEDLRTEITARIEASKKVEMRRDRERQLLDQLRERNPLELPAGVVEQEIEDMIRDYAETMRRQGVDLEKVGLDWERMAADVKPQAEERVHARLLLDAAAEAEKLKIDEEEFEQMLASLAARDGRSAFELRQELSGSGNLDRLRAQVLRQVALRHLLGEETSPDGASGEDETSEEA